jgi:hypothetical protein
MNAETRELTRTIDRRRRWRTRVAVAAIFVAFAALAFAATQYVTRANEQEQRADEAVSAADQLCAQVRQLGGLCVVDPEELRGPAGEAGPPGPGPTDAQVAEAVALYLAEFPPSAGRPPTMGEIADAVAIQLASNPPPQGERGPGPTTEQIAGAVAAYLLANPAPAGEQGPAGEDGRDGADSTVPGPPGPTGEPGAPGEPPFTWTFVTCGPLGVDCVIHRCVRDDPFDRGFPEYECQAVDE